MKKLLSITVLSAAILGSTGCADVGDSVVVDSNQAEATIRSRFDVWQAHNDEFYFHLEAGNGQILLSSEGYKNRTGALNGVLSVLDHGAFDGNYEIFAGNDHQFYVRLVAANHEIIGQSEGYTSRQSAEALVASSIQAVATHLEYWSKPAGTRFEVQGAANGDYYFNLHASNGEIVLTSETYATEAGCLNGAFSVAENGLNADNYQVLQAKNGEYYAVLKAANHQVIAVTEMYSTKSNAERAVDSIVELLPQADLL